MGRVRFKQEYSFARTGNTLPGDGVGDQFSSVAQLCPTFCDPMDCVAHQAPPSMGFSKKEYWSGVPLPSLFDIGRR